MQPAHCQINKQKKSHIAIKLVWFEFGIKISEFGRLKIRINLNTLVLALYLYRVCSLGGIVKTGFILIKLKFTEAFFKI
jgi:hypothetical protein